MFRAFENHWIGKRDSLLYSTYDCVFSISKQAKKISSQRHWRPLYYNIVEFPRLLIIWQSDGFRKNYVRYILDLSSDVPTTIFYKPVYHIGS